MEQRNEIEELRGNDLSPAMVQREQKPKETWFFQRGDGYVLACEEEEAWEIIYNRSTWKRRDFRIIGVSDGTTYARVAGEGKREAIDLQIKIEKLTKQLQDYQRVEHRIRVDEVVDMDDFEDPVNKANIEKIKRLEKIMTKLEAELTQVETQYKNIAKTTLDKAFEEEKKVAIANGVKMPRRMDIITPKTSPHDRNKILKIMEGRQ